MNENPQNRLDSVLTRRALKDALLELRELCGISYKGLEEGARNHPRPLPSSSLQRRLTGNGELDWMDIESMVTLCHAHRDAQPPEWSKMTSWRAAYDRAERSESAGEDALKEKDPKKKKKGAKPKGSSTRVKAGRGSVINLVHGKENKVRGSVTKNRITLLKTAAAVTLVALLSSGAALLIGDDNETAHPGPGSASESTVTGSASSGPSGMTSQPPSTSSRAPAATSEGPETDEGSIAKQSAIPTTGASSEAPPSPKPSHETRISPTAQAPNVFDAPLFKVTGGECDVSDAAQGNSTTLGNESSGFSNGGTTYNEIVLASDHTKSINTPYGHNGKVTNESSGWYWTCEESDPPGTYDVRVKDVKSGLWSNWSRLVINP
ncbi:hypothetical protein AB0M31_06125 [Streptomyces sp. NPDC051773]|uniref:hypothetical protein n=1 Tax=Streptomyces sp. NPDC051773 TaxID=3156682 RepID=UPI00342C1A5F